MMIARSFFFIAALLAASGFMDVARAGTTAPEVRPQWLTSFSSSTTLSAVDARVGTGVLATVGNRIAAFTPDGDLRWDAYTCQFCGDHAWVEAKLTADGGAWAIDRVGEFGHWDNSYNVNRLDAAGQVVLSLPIASNPPPLFGNDDQAVMVRAGNETLKWQRVNLDTMALETQTHTLPPPRFLSLQIESALDLPDGGISVTLEPHECGFICPPQSTVDYSIARLSADGALDWIVSFDSGRAARAALDHDGGAYAVVFADDGLWHLRRVSPAGVVATDVALPEVSGTLIGTYGPIAGRIVIVTDTSSNATVLHSLDENGNTLATRSMQDGTRVIDDSPLGLLVSANLHLYQPHSPEWIDPVSLETRATFRFSGEDVPGGSIPTYANAWHLLPDGTVYGADTKLNAWGLVEPRLARFSAPGYAPTELVFRSGFD